MTITLSLVASLFAACGTPQPIDDEGLVDAGDADADSAADGGLAALCDVDSDCESQCTRFGECEGFADTCSQAGTRTRECTDMACVEGACVAKGTVEEEVACTRDTEGVTCADQEFSCGACGEFDSTCDEVGTKECTEVNFACSAGACTALETVTEEGCIRSTDGDSCGQGLVLCGECQFESTCDETGAKTCQTTTFDCGNGSCGSTTVSTTVSCQRDTDGDQCGIVACGGSAGFKTRPLCCSAGDCDTACGVCN